MDRQISTVEFFFLRQAQWRDSFDSAVDDEACDKRPGDADQRADELRAEADPADTTKRLRAVGLSSTVGAVNVLLKLAAASGFGNVFLPTVEQKMLLPNVNRALTVTGLD